MPVSVLGPSSPAALCMIAWTNDCCWLKQVMLDFTARVSRGVLVFCSNATIVCIEGGEMNNGPIALLSTYSSQNLIQCRFS